MEPDFLQACRGEIWEGFPLKSLFEETGFSNEIDYQNAVRDVIRPFTGMGLGFWQACGERYERASLPSPFSKRWDFRMKLVIRMLLNMLSDRKPEWDSVFGKPPGRDIRGLPSQVPFWKNGVLEWNQLSECRWTGGATANRDGTWFSASLLGEIWEGFPLKSLFEEMRFSNEVGY